MTLRYAFDDREPWRFAIVFLCVLVAGTLAQAAPAVGEVRGVVFLDANGNGAYDGGEAGVEGVGVSNGREVVRTDRRGAYTLPAYDEMIVFVIMPSGYASPLDRNNIPRFYYVHRPHGSPASIRKYAGLSPTGPLPRALHFPLVPVKESPQFRAIAIGDTQVTDDVQLAYLRDSLVADLAGGKGAALAITMGDNVNNALSLYPRYLSTMRRIGVPLYLVPGNHDVNGDSPDDAHSLETYARFAGPGYYSFNVGKVHFVVLDSVLWEGKGYHGEIDRRQMTWLANDLAVTPRENLVVLNMHIPLVSWVDRGSARHMVANRQAVYAALRGRRALSLGGHTHTFERFVAGQEEQGWGQPTPFPQIVVGAACGSWWHGERGERSVPQSYQRGGSPRGYLLLDFDGTDFTARYTPTVPESRRQMNLSFLTSGPTGLPQGVFARKRLSSVKLVVNAWNATKDMPITCRIDQRPPVEATRETNVPDPFAVRLQQSMDKGLRTTCSPHLWTCTIPSDLRAGKHRVVISFVDDAGRRVQGAISFEVRNVAGGAS